MDLRNLSQEAFAALRLSFNDIWTEPEAKFRLPAGGAREELVAANILTLAGGYCLLTPEGREACQETFGKLIQQELSAQAQGGVVRVPFKGR